MPFQKGQSGNPKGPGAQKPFNDALRMEIAAAGANHKALRSIANKLVDMAVNGDIRAIKEVADRLEGKAVQQVEAEHTGHIAVAVTVRKIIDPTQQTS